MGDIAPMSHFLHEPTLVPSTRKSTCSMPWPSTALAEMDMPRDTIDPARGVRTTLVSGAVPSISTFWVLTGSAFPALSKARYLTVVVVLIVSGPLYGVPVVAVGSVPLVVYRIEAAPESASVANRTTEAPGLKQQSLIWRYPPPD